MKSTGVNCGNVNLKGKKSKLLLCQCCEAQDFRDEALEKVHMLEVREAREKISE